LGFDLLPSATTIDETGFQQGMGQAGDSRQGQGDATQLAQLAATGQAPSAAAEQQKQGLEQAQQQAAAQGASTRGGFGLGMAAKTAAGVQGNLAQQAVSKAAELRAGEQATARGQYLQATAEKRAQDLQAAGLSAQEAQAQAQLEQQQQLANQKESSDILAGAVGAGSSVLGSMLGMFSDESVKNPVVGDLHMMEPHQVNPGMGLSHWVLREEPNFVLMKNMRTGDVGKLTPDPLTRQDKAELQEPHGADQDYGDLGLKGGNQVYGDAPVGGGGDPISSAGNAFVKGFKDNSPVPQVSSAPAEPSIPDAPSFGDLHLTPVMKQTYGDADLSSAGGAGLSDLGLGAFGLGDQTSAVAGMQDNTPDATPADFAVNPATGTLSSPSDSEDAYARGLGNMGTDSDGTPASTGLGGPGLDQTQQFMGGSPMQPQEKAPPGAGKQLGGMISGAGSSFAQGMKGSAQPGGKPQQGAQLAPMAAVPGVDPHMFGDLNLGVDVAGQHYEVGDPRPWLSGFASGGPGKAGTTGAKSEASSKYSGVDKAYDQDVNAVRRDKKTMYSDQWAKSPYTGKEQATPDGPHLAQHATGSMPSQAVQSVQTDAESPHHTQYNVAARPSHFTPQASGAPSTFSDARAKQMEKNHTGLAAARQFLDTLEPHAFTWKVPEAAPNPKAAQVPNLGIFAQQVAKSPFGQAIVQKDPKSGLLSVDIKSLSGALAAGLGATKAIQDDHAKRLASLEAMATRRK
jgi:hypothetical protein